MIWLQDFYWLFLVQLKRKAVKYANIFLSWDVTSLCFGKQNIFSLIRCFTFNYTQVSLFKVLFKTIVK